MIFKQLQNIEHAFQFVRGFTMFFILASVALNVYMVYQCRQQVNEAQSRIYLLSEGQVLQALASSSKDNIPVEARDHVKMFHHYFFSLDPDDEAIKRSLHQALYMADQSAKRQYDNLVENRYYANIISGNISQEIKLDSVFVNIESYPFYFRYYGRQKIIRPTSIVERSLITEGYLRQVARTDHNPHGLLIERWHTLENKNLNKIKR